MWCIVLSGLFGFWLLASFGFGYGLWRYVSVGVGFVCFGWVFNFGFCCRWLWVVTACNCVLGCFLWCLGFLFVIALGLWFGFAFDVPLFCVDGSVGLCIVGV